MSKIRSAPQGYIELIGKARSLLTTPYYVPETDIRCVWFRYSSNTADPGDANQNVGWNSSKNSFLLDDGTGTCRIDPLQIEIIPLHSRSLLVKKRDGWGGLTFQWIAVDDVVHLYGVLTTLHVDYQKQAADLIKSKIKLLKSDREMMRKFDSNNDGNIDGDEWETARKHIEGEVSNYVLEKQKQHKGETSENVIRKPKDKRLPFLVSCHQELTLIRKYKIYFVIYLVLFLLFGVGVIDDNFINWLQANP